MSSLEEVPKGRYYTKTHEWLSIVSGNVVRIGITHYATHQLGDLTSVEVKPVGTEIKKGEAFGIVESAKASEYIYSPVSGKITAVNKEAGVMEEKEEVFVVGELEKITEDPYGEGWLIEMEAKDLDKEIQDLLSKEEYEEYLKTLS
ncbi:MAG: glycine cleavage system protein H [Thermoproteota archaeon]|nr:MAG: glycine cleavage system protein H [Candidatus Korarchaeota archaeon]